MVSDSPMMRSLTVLLAIPLLLGSALAQSPAPSSDQAQQAPPSVLATKWWSMR